MNRLTRRLRWPLLIAVLLTCVSCGGPRRKPVYPVRGQVYFQGKPTYFALVVFHSLDEDDPDPVMPVGRVGEDGSFTLSTYLTNDGAPAGSYAVTVIWREPLPGNEGRDPDDIPLGPDKLRGRYRDKKVTPLRGIEVQKKDNVLEPFHLK